eukprot:Gb_11618 [translate_table: standard]
MGMHQVGAGGDATALKLGELPPRLWPEFDEVTGHLDRGLPLPKSSSLGVCRTDRGVRSIKVSRGGIGDARATTTALAPRGRWWRRVLLPRYGDGQTRRWPRFPGIGATRATTTAAAHRGCWWRCDGGDESCWPDTVTDKNRDGLNSHNIGLTRRKEFAGEIALEIYLLVLLWGSTFVDKSAAQGQGAKRFSVRFVLIEERDSMQQTPVLSSLEGGTCRNVCSILIATGGYHRVLKMDCTEPEVWSSIDNN